MMESNDSVFIIGMVCLGLVAMMIMGGFGFSISFRSFNFSFRFG
jgi:hypothetical protein